MATVGWVELFLTATKTQAVDTVQRAERIENPVVTTRSIEDRLQVSRPTALRLLRRLEEREC
jgi:Mn-dependent DtxR family transcriptional regulator